MMKNTLSDMEIEKLKQIHPQKKILRFIFLILGICLIFFGIIFLFTRIDFGIKIDNIDLSFLVDILIIIAGMILASKFFIAPYYLRENSLTIKRLKDLREPINSYVKFNSFSFSRLLAAFLLIITGIWNYTVFGIGVGHHETRYGNAFFLGGPSFFYFTGLPALMIGFCLILYVILSVFRGTFSKSDNFLFFYELRPCCPWLTEVPKKDIEAIRYQNTEIGPKPAWIMLLIPFIVMQFQTAIPLFFNNERAGPEYVLSWTLTLTSIIEILVLGILLFYHQDFFEIATNDMLYEMWFSPLRLRSKQELRDEIKKYLNCGIDVPRKENVEKETSKSLINVDKNQEAFSNVSTTHFQLFDLIFGIVLIISAIIMLASMTLFGPLYWWVALMYGLILLIKAVNYDFSRKGQDRFEYDPENQIFKFERKFSYKFHCITAYDVQEVSVKKWFRKLDFFDIFGLGGMIIMLIVQQIQGWVTADSISVISDNIVSTIYMAIIFLIIFLYLFLPLDVVEFKTSSITYRIRITKKFEFNRLFNKFTTNLKALFKDIKANGLEKPFKIRFGVFLLIAVISCLTTFLLLLSYFI